MRNICLACILPALVQVSTAEPESGDMSGCVLEFSFAAAMECRSTLPVPTNEWTYCNSSPLQLQFPADYDKSFCTAQGAEIRGCTFASSGHRYGTIELKFPDSEMVISLEFTSANGGVAAIVQRPVSNDGSYHVRDLHFTLRPADSNEGVLHLPRPIPDALPRLISELAQRRYTDAVEQLYQRRLLEALRGIHKGRHYVDSVLANANGTTALHNACGLSHVEIVQWLVERGANLNARTAKGASVDDCVGGPNAPAIRSILQKARNNKQIHKTHISRK